MNIYIAGLSLSLIHICTGSITAESYGAVIIDENIKAPGNCKLKLWDDQTCFDETQEEMQYAAQL